MSDASSEGVPVDSHDTYQGNYNETSGEVFGQFPLIDVQGLTKQFGSLRAVSNIGFTVNRGEILGLVGPNGAGKTTTMRLITGYLTPDAGSVHIAGHDVAANSIAARGCIGYLPEGAPAWPEMTPFQLLRFVAAVHGVDKHSPNIQSAIQHMGLESVLHRKLDTLSKGFRRRVSLAMAIVHNPPVLIMDEPTDGLDPNQKQEVREFIETLAVHRAIILSTHALEEVTALCGRVLIINQGEIIANDTPTGLMARSRYHHAVTVTVERTAASTLRNLLDDIDGILEIEETTHSDDSQFTILPAGEASTSIYLMARISRLMDQHGLSARALYREQGRLDEVFQSLTKRPDASDTPPALQDTGVS
ncbi:MAG: ABC transporter ATP-binding protein [Parvularculales bacterium]